LCSNGCPKGGTTSVSGPFELEDRLYFVQWGIGTHFPLVDRQWNTLSVRQVFENHRDLFSSVVTIVNTEAIKLNGDILALASICLASMNADVGVGFGVPIPKFLAYVFHFLQPAQLDTNLSNQTIKGIEELLSGHSIKDTMIPCIAPADSVQALLSSGTLKCPRVAEMRDGAVYGQENNRLLHIECKNHAKGVDKSVFQEVIKWMRVGFKISLFFFSSVQNIFTNIRDYQDWMELEFELSNKSICLFWTTRTSPVGCRWEMVS
jgi:hypothetical protein